MADKKKSNKAGRKVNSASNKAYIAGGRRQVNAIKRLKRRIKEHPHDVHARTMLEQHKQVLSTEYRRGGEWPVRAHMTAMNAARLAKSRKPGALR